MRAEQGSLQIYWYPNSTGSRPGEGKKFALGNTNQFQKQLHLSLPEISILPPEMERVAPISEKAGG